MPSMSRSCFLSQPDCQYGLAIVAVSLPSGPRTSGYHSPHLPAGQPGGVEGTCRQSVTSGAAPAPVGGRRPWQAKRARHVRKEFRIIHALSGTSELQHEERRREGNDVVGGLVVVEIIVVVLHEEDRR